MEEQELDRNNSPSSFPLLWLVADVNNNFDSKTEVDEAYCDVISSTTASSAVSNLSRRWSWQRWANFTDDKRTTGGLLTQMGILNAPDVGSVWYLLTWDARLLCILVRKRRSNWIFTTFTNRYRGNCEVQFIYCKCAECIVEGLIFFFLGVI